ncbi:peptidase M23 [Sagittula sp. NFXS13]
MMIAAQAWAHEAGAHMHPHGSEGWLSLALAAVLVLAAMVVWRLK